MVLFLDCILGVVKLQYYEKTTFYMLCFIIFCFIYIRYCFLIKYRLYSSIQLVSLYINEGKRYGCGFHTPTIPKCYFLQNMLVFEYVEISYLLQMFIILNVFPTEKVNEISVIFH